MVKEPNGVRPVLKGILEAKKVFGPLIKDKSNPFFKSKYADLAALIDVVEKPLLDQEIMILQPTIVKPEGQYVRSRLIHVSGDEEFGELRIPDNLDAQKTVAAITYYKRATLQALLGIPAHDDDGETAAGRFQPETPSTPKSFTTDPKVAARDAKKAEKKAAAEAPPKPENSGLANVTVNSILPGNHPTVKFSKLETSGGTFIVMGDSPKFTDAMKAAQAAALSKSQVVIEYHTNAKGSMVVDVLRVEE